MVKFSDILMSIIIPMALVLTFAVSIGLSWPGVVAAVATQLAIGGAFLYQDAKAERRWKRWDEEVNRYSKDS